MALMCPNAGFREAPDPGNSANGGLQDAPADFYGPCPQIVVTWKTCRCARRNLMSANTLPAGPPRCGSQESTMAYGHGGLGVGICCRLSARSEQRRRR